MSYSIVEGPNDSSGKLSRSWGSLKSKNSGVMSGVSIGPPGSEPPRTKVINMVRGLMPKSLPKFEFKSKPTAPLSTGKITQVRLGPTMNSPARVYCPYKKSERLHFRRISKRGAALCNICGELTNGIISRCPLHDFNVCDYCYNLFYYLPTDQVLMSLFDQLGATDDNANETLEVIAANYPQKSGNLPSHEFFAIVTGQALGYALWYKPELLEYLYQVVENNTILSATAKQDALDNLLCIACMPDPLRNTDEKEGVVRHMLENSMVDPATHNNTPIGLATAGGHKSIVRMLTKDKRVDASDDNNYAIRMAAMNGHTLIVKRLLTLPKVKPSAMYSYALRIACKKGHVDIVRLLLKQQGKKQVYPQELENTALGLAASYGHAAIVKMLLKDERVDKKDCWDYALREAIIFGYKQIVAMLVTEATIEGAIEYARKYSYYSKSMLNFLIELENNDDVDSDTDGYDSDSSDED